MTNRIMIAALIAPLLLIGRTTGIGLVRADEGQAKPEETPKDTPIVVDLTLKGSIDEAPSPLGLDGTPIDENLRALLERIETAKTDETVAGLVLRIRSLTIGPAKIHELHRAIRDFRSSDKPVVAILETASNIDYWVATAADRIVMPDAGALMLTGLAAEVTFFKGLFDKLDIEADMIQVGEFKGAAEPFTRTEMSPEFREELTDVLTDEYELLAEAIAQGRGVSLDKARSLIDGGPYTPEDAVELKLIDRVAYLDQVKAELARNRDVETVKLDDKYGKPEPEDYSGLSGFMKLLQELSGQAARAGESDAPKIAVIYASGVIRTGKSSPASILGGAVMGSDTIVEQIEKAEQDETVQAIVLRVDSPGGSGLASDLIWRSVVEAEKPIVASMSDTAASGGYYISMGCDQIFAEPGTLTGSIGVVGGKIALGGLLEKIGVTTDSVTVGRNGALFSMLRPFTDEQEQAIRSLMEDTYRQFVSKAAEGRDMQFEELEKLAGGRIYSGKKAKEIGLVDELGTLDDAIASAKDHAGLKPDEEVEILVLPEPKSVFEALADSLKDAGLQSPTLRVDPELLPEPIRQVVARLEVVRQLLEQEPAIMLMPFELEIR